MVAISEAKQNTDIVGVFAGAGIELHPTGKNFVCICPFPGHSEKTPSCVIYPDQGRFHCYGCGASGDVIDFVRRLHGLSFPDALHHLGIEKGQELPTPEELERRRRRQELLRRFRVWQNEKSDILGATVRNTRRMLMNIKTLGDLERFGDLFHDIDRLEHEFEMLTMADTETVFNYFKDELKWALV